MRTRMLLSLVIDLAVIYAAGMATMVAYGVYWGIVAVVVIGAYGVWNFNYGAKR